MSSISRISKQVLERILQDHQEWLDSGKIKGVQANLQRASLRKVNLQEANLQEAILDEADLQGANLERVNLSEAYLEGANLTGANLNFASLNNALFSGANLQRASLRNANLMNANLQGVNLEESDLQGANLEKAKLIEADLQKTNLQDANLKRARLDETKLQGANLQRANLKYSVLTRADLEKANLNKANLTFAHLKRANLTGSNLSEANFDTARMEGAILKEVSLKDTNLEGARLLGANLRGIDLSSTNLFYTDLRYANLDLAIIPITPKLRPAQLAGSKLRSATLQEDFWGEILRNVVLAANHARKLFTPLMVACVYVVWSAIEAQPQKPYKVPLVQIEVSFQWFLLVGSVVISVGFAYLLYYLNRLWELITTLPAIFPDGIPSYIRPDPWFVISYCRIYNRFLWNISRPLQGYLAGLLSYATVPVTMTLIWWSYLSLGDWRGTAITLLGLFGTSIGGLYGFLSSMEIFHRKESPFEFFLHEAPERMPMKTGIFWILLFVFQAFIALYSIMVLLDWP